MVYVQNIHGVPLMPTERYGKVRRLLRDKKAEVINRTPFTIRLIYETAEDNKEFLTLGVDAGSKTIGLSVTSEKKEYFRSEVALRTDIVELLSDRRERRKARRGRKTRYRKPRFENRVRTKRNGWLAPSIREKIGTHLSVVDGVMKILPVSKIVVETASFDTQMLRAIEQGDPLPHGKDYQRGEQLNFWNVREYVLFRDGHVCQCCLGKSKDRVLNVHHIESRKTGGNSPTNLITLCETCHDAYHKGKIELPERVKRGKKYNDAAFMGIMRWAFYNRLNEIYPEIAVCVTFGYITKNTRITNGLPKEHSIDARCITGNPNAEPSEEIFLQKKVRCHNRKLFKSTIGKGGKKKRNQVPKYLFGYQLFDRVRMPDGREGFVFARRRSGSFDIRTISGEKLSAGISYRKLKPLEKRKTILIERKRVDSSARLKPSVSAEMK